MPIFQEYYKNKKFFDKYKLKNKADCVDVIIPLYHTNDLWRSNLFSIYREIPVKRLLISNGGVIDDSISVVKSFPRVHVFNHTKIKTLGKCIIELINKVETEWFIYLHSDVYLPRNWYKKMCLHKHKYDWFGCPMNITALVEYRLHEPNRPYAGSQMGRTNAFRKISSQIDDDYIYRQEDFVWDQLLRREGFRTGKIENTFHYHQIMFRKSKGYDLKVRKINVETQTSFREKQRAAKAQLLGWIKYLHPENKYMTQLLQDLACDALVNKLVTFAKLKSWADTYNKKWSPYLTKKIIIKATLKKYLVWARNKFNII